MQAATIKLFLPTGDATAIRTAEISNWTGKAIAGPRTEIDTLVQRPELDSPGVYLLLGHDDVGDPLIYIGEAECVKTRLKQHKDKEFWVQVIAFTSKDENLTKGHIKYLEAELIRQAKAVGKGTLDNSQGGNAVLPESDIADMQVFLSKMFQLLPVLGTDVFAATSTKKPKPANLLYCKKGAAVAQGQRSPKGFVIFKGSQAVRNETASIPPSIRAARSKLIEKGILLLDGDVYVFTADHECTSPSLAAAIVRGGSANGMTEWKNKAGKTLKTIESE
ncbi:GIY-YIG nuclease family protein [Pontiellaceae bacterium B1224]|nr:GIY-YIG nuclease family protein [Pontiellaceae bacterium B1224]